MKKNKMNMVAGVLMTMLFLGTLVTCGGGGGGGPTNAPSANDQANPPDSPSTTAFAGFDFTLQEGDFWEYSWDYEDQSWDSFDGASTETDSGTFRLTLGTPTEIGGVTAFEVIVTGYSQSGFRPRWKYIALDENEILGSIDGTTLVTLFDAQTGLWPGSGFFTTFPEDKLCAGSNGTIDNLYINSPAIVIGQSSNQDQCQYFPGYGTICGGDLDVDRDIREYYGENIGPLGYYSHLSVGDMTSQYPWSSNTTKNVGLVKSSLRGETVNYDFETEPNDSPVTAQPMTFGWEIHGLVRYEDVATTVYLNEVQEAEPNNSRIAPQFLSFPAHVEGSVSQADSSSWFQFLYNQQLLTINAEDWYSFTLLTAKPLTIELEFPGSTTADLDLYLFPVSSSTPYYYSIGDNPATKAFKELIQVASLSAGTYIIAVDADRTPGGSIPYTLDISETYERNEVTVEDWYSFTLASLATVTISLNFDDVHSSIDLYLFDQTGGTHMASSRNDAGLPESITITLGAGTYKVGVDLAGQIGTHKYTLTIQEARTTLPGRP
jgi:hypothetical protein